MNEQRRQKLEHPNSWKLSTYAKLPIGLTAGFERELVSKWSSTSGQPPRVDHHGTK